VREGLVTRFSALCRDRLDDVVQTLVDAVPDLLHHASPALGGDGRPFGRDLARSLHDAGDLAGRGGGDLAPDLTGAGVQ
jgi:hypothetical protein